MKQIMATFMRKIGCNYDTASNGLIALEKYMASERPYDYVLMGTSTIPCFKPSHAHITTRYIHARHGRPRVN